MAERAFYSIDEKVLSAFNRLVPAGQRSRIIESFMADYVADDENRLARAAEAIENDPSYAAVMRDAEELGFENLARLDADTDARPSAA
jgi:hypothetical protein